MPILPRSTRSTTFALLTLAAALFGVAGCSSNDKALGASGAPNPAAGDGGPASADGGPTSVVGECFGYPKAGEDAGAGELCTLGRCCGAWASCGKDSECTAVWDCVMACTTQACVNSCLTPLQDPNNIASQVWYDDFAACMTVECFNGNAAKPPPADQCAKNTDCKSCLNDSTNPAGNCGWLSDGTCHSGSTAGPDDPSVWNNARWTFFDDTACPGGSSTGGCTSNSDCSGCARCELSTGQCVSCPVGSAGVCSC